MFENFRLKKLKTLPFNVFNDMPKTLADITLNLMSKNYFAATVAFYQMLRSTSCRVYESGVNVLFAFIKRILHRNKKY